MNENEKAILQAVQELGAEAYTVPIRERVNQILNRRHWWNEISIGTLFVTLDCLEEQGLLHSYSMPGGKERGFRSKRYFYLTRYASTAS